jgi:hypothetical protein
VSSKTFVPIALALVSVVACAGRPPSSEVPAPAPRPFVPLLASPGDTSRTSATLALARLEGRDVGLLADEDDSSLVELDLSTGATRVSSTLPSAPRSLLVLPDGRVAVALAEGDAVVFLTREIAPDRYRETSRIVAPRDPRALALSEDRATLFVSSGASHTVSAFRLRDGVELGRADVGREPRGLVASGEQLFVTHAAADGLERVSVMGLLSGAAVPENIGFSPAPCLDPDACEGRVSRQGRALALTEVKGNPTVLAPVAMVSPKPLPSFAPMKVMAKFSPERGSDFGGGDALPGNGALGGSTGYGTRAGSAPPELFALQGVGVFDHEVSQLGGLGFSEDTRRCLVPTSIVVAKRTAFVACAGSRRIVAAPLGSSESEPEPTPTSFPSIEAEHEPDALLASRDGSRLYAWSRSSRTLVTYRLPDAPEGSGEAPPSFGLAEAAPRVVNQTVLARLVERDASWLKGRELFHGVGDRRISSDGRACASCHVDGADDAIVWVTPQGKRRTRTLAGQLGAGPYGWQGEHATLDEHVRTTFKQLGGEGLAQEDLASLVGYVKSLAPPVANEVFSADALEGRRLFASATFDCASCHEDEGRTSDRTPHDVGSDGRFLTPSLAGVATRPTLFHDGRYRSLEDMLDGATAMGNGSRASADEKKKLLAYLQVL